MENQLKDTIEITSGESYIIYDALCSTVIKYYNIWQKTKMENPYEAPYYEKKYDDIKKIADKFSKLNLKNGW